MKTHVRIAINLLAPPLTSSCILLAAAATRNAFTQDPVFTMQGAGFVIVISYLFGSIPSFAHAVLMELSYRFCASPHSWRSVAISSLSGTLAGATVALIVFGIFAVSESPRVMMRASPIATFTSLGLVTGAIIGTIIRILSLKSLSSSAHAGKDRVR